MTHWMEKKHLGRRLLLPLFIGGALLGLFGSWVTYEAAVSHIRGEFVHRGQILAGAIAGLVNATEGGSQQSFVDLRIAVEEFAALETGVLEVMIATRDPIVILVSTAHAGVASDATLQSSLIDLRRSIDEGRFGHYFDEIGDLTLLLPMRPVDIEIGETIEPLSETPLPNGGSELRYAESDYRGVILLKLDWSSVHDASTILLWQAVLINLASILVILGLAYGLLRRMVLKPMAMIRSTLVEQEENRANARVPALVNDEIGNLAGTLNHMLDAIEMRDRSLQQSRDELEKEVEERTRELRAATSELVRRERLATLGQLSSTVSHELRNPLGTIRNSLFTIRRRSQGADIDIGAPLDRADTSIERCNTIIGELLDYASDKAVIKQAASLDDWLARELDELNLPDAVELRRHLASGAEIEFSPDALHQVVVNLVDNACQAMTDERAPENGSPVLEVATGIEGNFAVLSISDTGPGVPAEARDRIFEPLYSTRSFGVGLGLPLVKKIVEQHDGRIEIDSPNGSGARFRLLLPLAEAGARNKQGVMS